MERLEQLRAYMVANDVDMCIFKHPENVCLMSGYWPRNGFSFYVVDKTGEPVIIAPEGDVKDPELGYVEDIRRFGYIKVKDGNPYDNIAAILSGLKTERGIPDNGHVMMDTGFDVIGVPVCSGEIGTIGINTEAVVKSVFKCDKIMPGMDIIVQMRAIKRDSDIEKLEIANEIGLKTCDYFKEIAVEGQREIDVAAKAEAFFAMTAAGYKGSRYGKAWVQISSGEKTASEGWYAGIVSENKVLEKGDMVMLEMGAVVDGYWCDLTTVTVVGGADDLQQEVMTIVHEAQRKAIAAMKPGVKASAMYDVANEHIIAKGYGDFYPHGLGHGVGFMYHEAIPGLGPGSDIELKEGMVMSCEPGIYIDGKFGVRYEANVLITATGAKVLGE